MKNKNAEKQNFGEKILAWRAPEFHKPVRGAPWMFVMSALVLALIAWGIFSDSVAFSAVVVLLAGVYFLTHNRDPQIIEIAVTDLGVLFGEKFFAFSEIDKFWIFYEPPLLQSLNLKLNRGAVREIAIELSDEVLPAEIRAVLENEIFEDRERRESLSEILIRALRL